MDKDFSLEKKNFIEIYNLARPVMTILGDQVRQEILLALIESGGMGGIRVGEIQKKSQTFQPYYANCLSACSEDLQIRAIFAFFLNSEAHAV